MSSVLKVDRIQSDTGTINLASGISFTSGLVSAPSIFPSGDTNTGIFFPAADTIAFAEGGAEAMRIDANGNVGIGTSAPAARLNLASTGNDYRALFDDTTNDNTLGVYSDATNIRHVSVNNARSSYKSYGIQSNGIIFSATNGSESARITGDGRFLIGDTANASSPAAKRLFVHDTSATNDPTVIIRQSVSGGNGNNDCGVLIDIQGVSNTDRILTGRYFNTGGTPTRAFEFFRNGDMQIFGSSATKASGTTWANPSDQRLKNNIRDYEKGLAELQQVRVREWEYNGKGNTTEGIKGLGVVADEIMSLLPNTVDTYEAKLNKDDEETTTIKRFDATEITWLLVNAVKELKVELETVKAELAILKGQT